MAVDASAAASAHVIWRLLVLCEDVIIGSVVVQVLERVVLLNLEVGAIEMEPRELEGVIAALRLPSGEVKTWGLTRANAKVRAHSPELWLCPMRYWDGRVGGSQDRCSVEYEKLVDAPLTDVTELYVLCTPEGAIRDLLDAVEFGRRACPRGQLYLAGAGVLK